MLLAGLSVLIHNHHKGLKAYFGRQTPVHYRKKVVKPCSLILPFYAGVKFECKAGLFMSRMLVFPHQKPKNTCWDAGMYLDTIWLELRTFQQVPEECLESTARNRSTTSSVCVHFSGCFRSENTWTGKFVTFSPKNSVLLANKHSTEQVIHTQNTGNVLSNNIPS